MNQNQKVNISTERDETLPHAYYSPGIVPALHVAQFTYSAPRRGLLHQVAAHLGARLNAPLSDAHHALLESDAQQSPEDLALVERMVAEQRESLAN